MLNYDLYNGKSRKEVLKHIPELSYYNHNYYIGLDNKLIYAESDDDNMTEYYYINLSNMTETYFAYSYTSEKDIIHIDLIHYE